MGDRAFDLEERLLEFAARIIAFSEHLPSTRSGNHVAGQLLRCGTSPLFNHGEAEAAESRDDFIHKLRVCLKELRETNRCLLLTGRAESMKRTPGGDWLRKEVDELIRIFVVSLRTSTKRRDDEEQQRRSKQVRPRPPEAGALA